MKYTSLIRRILDRAFYPIKSNFAFFVFMFVLGYICGQFESSTVSGATVLELFVDLYVVCFVLSVIPHKIRRWVRAVLYVIFYLTTIVDLYCFVKFKSTLTPTMLLLVGETNSDEASEFIESYLNWDILSSSLGWVLLLLLVHIVCSIAVVVLHHIKHKPNVKIEKLKRLTPFVMPVLGILTIYCCGRGIVERWDNKVAMTRLMSQDNIGGVEHELTRSDRAELYLPVYRFAFSIFANELTSQQIDKLVNTIDKVKVDSCSYRSRNIVLIIGESYNRHHSQLYGYDKPTTPRQVKLAKEGSLTPFTDVVSPWNLTSFVFKNVFSLHAVGDRGEWCDYPLFPEVFRKAGYRVTFITNQFLPQAREAVYDFSGGFFLNNPVLDKAQFDVRNTALHEFDDGVLSDYDDLLGEGRFNVDNKDDNNLIILHLKGQHVDYKDRTPQERKVFGPDDYDIPTLNRRDRWRLADYDNATLYNDSIVDQIVSRFADKDAIVIYMPDHAEECYADGKPIFGRLHSAAVDYRLAREEFEIPFWIWCSNKYAKTHKDVVKMIKAARDRPFMTDNLAQMLLFLAGISCPDYRDEYNILSPNFDEKRPRLLKNTVDYNTLKPSVIDNR